MCLPLMFCMSIPLPTFQEEEELPLPNIMPEWKALLQHLSEGPHVGYQLCLGVGTLAKINIVQIRENFLP